MNDCPLVFAVNAHGNQKYGNHLYRYHLLSVATVLARFGYEDNALYAASFLHDVIEDTPVTIEEITEKFGPEVADIVSRVTNIVAPTRQEKLAKTYPRIAASSKTVALKLADRIANVEECLRNNPTLLGKYQREYEGFRNGLHTKGMHPEMWSHLDSLLSVNVCGES